MDFFQSSKSLKQITEAGVENDFSFRVFDETIQCNIIVAIYISKKVSKLYLNDRTIREYFVNFPSKSIFYSTIDELKQKIQRTNFIKEIQNFVSGDSLHFDVSNTKDKQDIEKAQILIEFGKIIENEEMIENGFRVIMNDDKSEMTLEESINRIQIYHYFGVESNENNLSKEYDFISSNFYSIMNDENKNIVNKLKEMSNDELEHIISSDKLQIESENDLFEIIKELGRDKNCLLGLIEIQFLSVDKVNELIELINEFDLSISGQLWSSICRRLTIDILQVNKNKNNRVRDRNKSQTKSEKSIMNVNCENGIFKYLQKAPNENIYLLKTIDVEVSGIRSGEIKNLFDHSKDTFFRADYYNGNGNGYIIFDFKNIQANIEKYYFSMPTSKTGQSGCRPKTWLIEGSNDKQNWTVIDRRNNDTSLHSYEASNTFKTQKNNDFYRFIRIQSIESSNGSSDHRILLSEIEFYGEIRQNN